MKTLAALALTAVLVGALLGVAYWRLDQARCRAITRNRLADARARVGLPAPAPDNVPSGDAAVQDALELLWDLPAYGTDDHTTTNPTGDQP